LSEEEIRYSVVVNPKFNTFRDFLEMMRHCGLKIVKWKETKDGKFIVTLEGHNTPAFDLVNWNRRRSIPRWKQFGFEVIEEEEWRLSVE